MSLTLHDLRCRAGAFELAVDATFSGQVTGLFGPSGAGKTTVLEIVAGLRRPWAGRVALGDVVFDDPSRRVFVPPEARCIGYVPQDGALFPHLSVEGNIRYGLRVEAPHASTTSVGRVCELLDLGDRLNRRVTDLSGGEQQRVAIARALVIAPRLLLLDEPLSSLDAARKESILPYLRRLRDELRIPMLYVSHALPEIVALCDDVAVLDRGRIIQQGPTDEVLRRPASADVARLVGVETVVRGRVESLADGLVVLALGAAHLTALAPEVPATTREVLVTVRAEDVILLHDAGTLQTSARNRLSAIVRALIPAGATVRVELDCGFPLVALLTRQAVDELALAPGRAVHALIKAPHVHVIPLG